MNWSFMTERQKKYGDHSRGNSSSAKLPDGTNETPWDLNAVERKKGRSVTDGVYRGGKVFTRILVSLTEAGSLEESYISRWGKENK